MTCDTVVDDNDPVSVCVQVTNSHFSVSIDSLTPDPMSLSSVRPVGAVSRCHTVVRRCQVKVVASVVPRAADNL